MLKLQITNNIFSELLKKKHKSGGLTTFDVPVLRTELTLEYQTITDPILIEKIILCWNILHFWQAESTPLAGPEIIEKIGLSTTTNLADTIIDEKVDKPPLTTDPTNE